MINAQNNSDQMSSKLLNEVSTKLKGYSNLVFTYKGNFKNVKSGVDMNLQGDAKISGEKYNVKYKGITYLFDGEKQYVINREDKQVDISSASGSDLEISPSNIFTFYDNGYNKVWDEEKNEGGRRIQYIKLIPIKYDADYKKVMLGIDTVTKHIYNVIITEKSGTVVTFTLKSLKTDQPLAANTFTFDKSDYPDYQVEILD
jgi:hypothetical protein